MTKPAKRKGEWFRGNAFCVSVARADGSGYHEFGFGSDVIAGQRFHDDWDKWLDSREGPPPDPAAYKQQRTAERRPPTTTVGFDAGIDLWLEDEYGGSFDQQPDTIDGIRADIDNHLRPFFAPLAPDDVNAIKRRHVKDFRDLKQGRGAYTSAATKAVERGDARGFEPSEWLTVSQAAELAEVSKGTIKRMVRDGRLPGSRLVRSERGRQIWAIPAIAVASSTTRRRRVARTGLSKNVTEELLGYLRRMFDFLIAEGIYSGPNPAATVHAKKTNPRVALKQPDRRRRRAITLAESALIAALLHPRLQVALWLMRVGGLTISEAFGVRVRHVLDYGDFGIINIEELGGKTFKRWDPETGEAVSVKATDELKREARGAPAWFPPTFMEYYRWYLAEYIADEQGLVDQDAKVVVGFNGRDASQTTLYEALTRVLRYVGLDYDAVQFHISTHDGRRSYSTESKKIDRIAGSVVTQLLRQQPPMEAGESSVTRISYTHDVAEMSPFLKAVKRLDKRIRRDVGSLLLPLVPNGDGLSARAYTDHAARLYGLDATPSDPYRSVDRFDEALRHARRTLAENALATFIASDVGEGPVVDGLATRRVEITSADNSGYPLAIAADLLGLATSTLRRWAREGKVGIVGRTVGSNGYILDAEDVDRLRGDIDQLATVANVSDDLGISRDVLFEKIRAKEIAASKHPAWGVLVIADKDVKRLRKEVERIARLRQRSVRAGDAATILGVYRTTVNKLLESGDLVLDEETDSRGGRYITRESLDTFIQHRERRAARRPRQMPNRTHGADDTTCGDARESEKA